MNAIIFIIIIKMNSSYFLLTLLPVAKLKAIRSYKNWHRLTACIVMLSMQKTGMKVYTYKTDRCPEGQPNTHHYTDPYITNADSNKNKKALLHSSHLLD